MSKDKPNVADSNWRSESKIERNDQKKPEAEKLKGSATESKGTFESSPNDSKRSNQTNSQRNEQKNHQKQATAADKAQKANNFQRQRQPNPENNNNRNRNNESNIISNRNDSTNQNSNNFNRNRRNYSQSNSNSRNDFNSSQNRWPDRPEQASCFSKESTASSDVQRFWLQLTKRVSLQSGKFDLREEEQKIWLDTWKAAACGAKGPVKILPIAYLRLPATLSFSPPPIDIINVFIQVSITIKTNDNTRSHSSDLPVINIIEAIFDTVNSRLTGLLQVSRNNDLLLKAIDELEKCLFSTITSILPHFPAYQERLAHLILRKKEIVELKKRIGENYRTQELETDEIDKPKDVWLGWQQSPRLDWLMSGAWHEVDGLKAIYGSSQEYTQSLLKLWTLLTFYWGSGAVWPKCAYKQGGGDVNNNKADANVCGEPMLTIATSGVCVKCGGSNGSWRCFRQTHHSVCKKCLLRLQDALVGGPGPHASTDIYDAVVEREVVRRGETIYLLKNLESRKPPKIAPNWKTSYRLPISVLVAVVKLSVSHEPLNRSSSIQWGEIVVYNLKDGANQDWLYRSQGCMALRLLNKGDCVGMPDESELFIDVGVPVAIIDLRVFVPEVISVLNTFSKKDFTDQLNQIPFCDRLIGQNGGMDLQKDFSAPNQSDSLQVCIGSALENSEIEYVQRLQPIAKSQLIAEICSLKPIRSLSGTQLEAFAAALFSSVHCTQGPPGTGKSYIGVCLVLALDLIRKKAESQGQAVGPILVLSYKNHALDEFLCDVVTQYSTSSNDFTRYQKTLRPGMLIRTGKPEIDTLEQFMEKHSPLEIKARQNLEDIVMAQRKTRSVIKDLLECARSLEFKELDWIPQLDIFKNRDSNACFSANVVCAALTLYCAMNEDMKKSINQIEASDEEKLKDLILFDDEKQKSNKLISLSDDEMVNTFNQSAQGQHSSNINNRAFELLQNLADNALIPEHETLNKSMLELIIGLSKDLEYWTVPKNRSNIFFYLSWWLKGKNPPPRCQALILDLKHILKIQTDRQQCQCFEEASQDSPFCSRFHCCHYPSCKNQRKNDNPTNTMYCSEHNCSLKECNMQRFKKHKFCAQHICSACLITNSKESKSKIQCIEHQCTVNSCVKQQVYPYKGYCVDHVCIECCLSKSDKHLPRLNKSTLCDKHKCNVSNCINKKHNENVNSCSLHLCRICTSFEKLISADLSCPQSQLCSYHRCSQPSCLGPKIPNSHSQFCSNHSCKECIILKCSTINSAIDKPPRNTCKNHPLCTFINNKGKLCSKAKQNKGFYCIEHSQQNQVLRLNTKCSGKTTGKNNKGKDCNAKAIIKIGNRDYCDHHKDQAPTQAIQPESDSSESEDDDNHQNQSQSSKLSKISLVPVLPSQPYTNRLNQIRCQQCDIYIFSEYDHLWLCPLHEIDDLKVEELNNENQPKFESEIKPIKNEIKVEHVSKPTKKETICSKADDKLNPNDEKQKKSEIIDEAVEFSEPLASNANPDEMEDYFFDLEEDQQNEELKRLQEQTEIAVDYTSDDDEDDLAEEKQASNANNSSTSKTASIDEMDKCIDLTTWSWSWSHQDRLIAAAKLIRLAALLCKRLNKILTEQSLALARKRCSEAGAQSFRNARIVGATVVGASRRLESLRSANPFACVIEEACEVIEPTLMSVLAVNTLRKLEMIGDHRQLPAFVQQCWFNFETTMPSIKTSLFERLISGQVKSNRRDNKANTAAILPHTVLDEQRRMRSSIADLTRPDYVDLVQIKDHQHTANQCIGDVVIRSCVDGDQVRRVKEHRLTWPSKGRCVPGVLKNIYFWDLANNAESRPIAGLSACNQTEAEAVASLTKWLMFCGCPPASISIITPYKGQKTAITQALRKSNCLPPFRHDKPPPRGTTLTISTVDRYQGDENDIVILSLVRCNPGNRFVGLQNRFVVAVSRARLGFFVVGSVKALVTNRNGSEGPSHWRRFVSSLSQKDETKEDDTVRCGSSLPICCPRHGKLSSLNVTKMSEFPNKESWTRFCSLECQTVLDRCGHLCKLPCHSPIDIKHNQKCNELLDRPCEMHPTVPLFCNELPIRGPSYWEKTGQSQSPGESLTEALNNFECKIKVDYTRPECGHIVSVKCHEKKLLDAKKMSLEDCVEIVSDYIHPICNHRFKKPKCSVKRNYELRPPLCTENVLHTFKCKCEASMMCYKSIEEFANPSICNKSVEVSRPRCGHVLSMRCNQATKLKADWEQQHGKSAVDIQSKTGILVYYGESYGPPESILNSSIPQCQVPVTYVANCGHQQAKIPCSTSFEYSNGTKTTPKCTHQVSFQCFVCLSKVSGECWLANELKQFKIWNDENVFAKDATGYLCIREASFENANNMLAIKTEVEKCLPRLCQAKINVLRVCSLQHKTFISCFQLLEVLTKKKRMRECNAQIDRVLQCNHSVRVLCGEKTKEPPPVCSAKVDDTFTFSCGVHETKPNVCSELTRLNQTNPECMRETVCTRFRCSHKIMLPCNMKKYAEQFSHGRVLTPGESIVISSIQYCDEERKIKPCNEIINYKYEECSHIRGGVKCSEAFLWASDNEKQPGCKQIIDFVNPICGHSNKAPCHDVTIILNKVKSNEWVPWPNQNKKPQVIEYVLDHDENNIPNHGYSIKEESLESQPQKPNGISKEALSCENIFEFIRKCGHTSVITCSNVYWKMYSPCDDIVSIECDKSDCKHKKEIKCHIYEADKRAGKQLTCKNKVSRLCQKCNINKVRVACSEVVIECNEKATVTLELCSHEVTWSCGTDEDPRINPTSSCQSCVFGKWDELLNKEVTFVKNENIIEQIHKNIDKFFGDFVEIEKNLKIHLPKNFDDHNNAVMIIINRFLTNAYNNNIVVSLPKTESFVDLSNYDIVFMEVEKDFPINNFYFDQINTKYGLGNELTTLNRAGLKSCKPDKDGMIYILVGAAYRFNISPYSLPYRIGENKKAKQAANKLRINQLQVGFDCIQTTPDQSELKRHVYWEPGSCCQLKLMTLKIREQCKICFDYFPDKDNGYACSKKHFVCWECFEENVKHASGPDSVGKCTDDDGNLLCIECSEKATLFDVAKEKVPKNVFALLEDLKSSLIIKKAVTKALKEQEERLKKEHERIMAIQDEAERKVERLRLEIIEEILTLRCPGCKCAFIDYTGCAALTCGICKVGFCALCLVNCGTDAHSHVPNCQYNQPGREIFINEDKFKKTHSKRRENLINQKLKNETDKVKNTIIKKMEKDFRDLGIQINSNAQNLPAPTKGPNTSSFFDFLGRF